MIGVVVVEDDYDLRHALVERLQMEDDLSVVGAATDGPQAVEVVCGCRPEVVLMDIRLSGFDGIEAIRRLRAGECSARILFTAFAVEDYLIQGLAYGADGFLLKSISSQELVEAIRAAAAGEPVVAQAMLRPLIDRAVAGYTASLGERGAVAMLERLTHREREVLDQICRGRRDREIAATLFISLTTVKGYVQRIIAALEVNSRVGAAIVGLHAGLGGDTGGGREQA